MRIDEPDPTLRQSLREAAFVLVFWLACFLWSVGYCYLYGYSDHPRTPGDVSNLTPDLSAFDRTVESLRTPLGLGIPDWAMWGVLAPWAACIAITVASCFTWMNRDPEDAPSDGGEEAR